MATSKEPIKRLLSRPDLEQISKNLPNAYLRNARHQYQNLLEYLRKLKQEYPDKAKMLERKEKPTRTKKADSSADFTKDKEIFALFDVLKMTDSKEEEWNEFNYLLNARYFLKEFQKDSHPLPTHRSMHTEKMTPHTTKADGHGAKSSPTSSNRQPMGAVLGSENNPIHQIIEDCPSSQSYTQGMANASGMSKNTSDPQNTYHGFSGERGREKAERATNTGKPEIQQTNKTGTSEKQRTDLQKDNHPLPTHQSKYTEKMTPHTTKDGGHGAIASPTSSDRQTMGIVLESDNNPTRQNIEGRHPSQSYTKGMAIASDMSKNISDPQKTYHGFPELGREKPEWATKTGKSEIQPTVKAGKSERQQTDSTSGDIINAESEVERPLFLLLSRKRSSEAEKEYQRLLDNLKEMFKDRQKVPTNKTWETSTDIDDIKEEQKNKKEKGLIKTAYEKDFDSMEIPRKSYEDLQNELVEKNKQIDELTSRLRDIETKRADLSGKPLNKPRLSPEKNKSTDGML